jgi:hypothetical protein
MQPSTQPTTAPSAPTSQPSSKPSAADSNGPEIIVATTSQTSDFVYMCNPTHLHSSENIYQPVFRGLSLTSDVFMDRIIVWMTPFNKKKDKLSLTNNDYNSKIFQNTSVNEFGVMEINRPIDDELNMTAVHWNNILNSITYKLDIVVRIV